MLPDEDVILDELSLPFRWRMQLLFILAGRTRLEYLSIIIKIQRDNQRSPVSG